MMSRVTVASSVAAWAVVVWPLSALAIPPWTSENDSRILLRIDALERIRSNSPVSVEVDFQKALRTLNVAGTFDAHTVEVVPVEHDHTGERSARVRRVPHRVDTFHGITAVMLHFVLPNQTCTGAAIYFDTVESARGDPHRYHGLIGDDDLFCEGYGPREIAASHFDCFVDFDGDGDLDLFKGGVEPFVHCYENTGRNRFINRGRLTSGGKLFTLPCSKSNRSWVTIAFHDIDGDGDQDFFPSFGDGPDAGKIVFYENTTREHDGRLTFTRAGPLETVSGLALAGGAQSGGWFPSITFVDDWDGDGKAPDILVGSRNRCWLYRHVEHESGRPRFAEPTAVQAGGRDIELTNPRFECADIDGDGDFDLFAGTQPGPVHLFKNGGTRTTPQFGASEIIAWTGKYLIRDAHSGIEVADFDGDGRLDVVSGRFWERTDLNAPEASRDFGGFFRNMGTPANPRFERQQRGGPHIEQVQPCDAVRQNCVRAIDWDGDGATDLLAGDTDGFIWCFRHQTGNLFPLFDPGEKLFVGDEPLNVAGSGGHARFDVCDWNNDGRKDLVVADGHGTLTLFLHAENRSKTGLDPGEKIMADGKPLQLGSRASVLVCDWNADARKDLVLADDKGYYISKNNGADEAPVLASPAPIAFGGKNVNYVRPNLGSFVDWDGDGKRDLIACHFENSIRFYRNIGSGAPNTEPEFADPEGIVILEGESPQMISGVDAIDWNGDGDIDLLTGQGHGGSGLRFYERDWVEDEIKKSHPVVKMVAVEKKAAR